MMVSRSASTSKFQDAGWRRQVQLRLKVGWDLNAADCIVLNSYMITIEHKTCFGVGKANALCVALHSSLSTKALEIEANCSNKLTFDNTAALSLYCLYMSLPILRCPDSSGLLRITVHSVPPLWRWPTSYTQYPMYPEQWHPICINLQWPRLVKNR